MVIQRRPSASMPRAVRTLHDIFVTNAASHPDAGAVPVPVPGSAEPRG